VIIGQDTFFSDPMNQFMPLFHNGEIGSKLRIKNFVETESAQTGNHLTGYKSARSHSHCFTDTDTNCRGSLNYDYFYPDSSDLQILHPYRRVQR